MKSGKKILTVVAAATAGLITGFLFAPEKGSRMRRKIIEKGEDSLVDIKDNIDESIREIKKKLKISSYMGCKSNLEKPAQSTKSASHSST